MAWSGIASADQTAIAVVVHRGDGWQKSVGPHLLANIYRRKLVMNGDALLYAPVNLPAADPLRRAFNLSLFRQSPEEMQSYWNEQYFHGVSPPHVVGSSEAVLRFVEATPGALGYVLECELDERVELLLTLPLPEADTGLAERC